MTQTSLLAFFVGGAALSMAYYDQFVILAFLLPQIAALLPEAVVGPTKWRVNTQAAGHLSASTTPVFSRGEYS